PARAGDAASPSAACATGPRSSPTSASTSTTTSPTVTQTPVTPVSTTPTTPTAPAAPVTSATISVDGVSETVKVGSSFPAAQPLFVLVSLTRTTAKIGISGGSLESGAATVTLTKGKPLTLLNTANGT